MAKKRARNMLDEVPPEGQAVGLAFIVSILRVIYDKDETKPVRILLEGVICGLLSLATFHAIDALGMDLNWTIFAGGLIGFLGTETVHAIALKLVNKRV